MTTYNCVTKYRILRIQSIYRRNLLTSLILCYFISIGQPNTSDFHKIDSLQQVLNSTYADDTQKIKVMYTLGCLQINNGHLVAGLKNVFNAKSISQTHNYIAGESYFYSFLAFFHRYTWMSRIFLLKKEKYDKEHKLTNTELYPQNDTPKNDYLVDRLTSSQIHKAIDTFSQLDRPEILAHLYALTIQTVENPDSIVLYLTKATQLFSSAGKREEGFHLLILRLFILRNPDLKDEKEKIIDAELNTINYIESTIDKKTKGLLYEQFANYYDIVRRHSSTIQCYLKSLEIWEELNDSQGQIRALHNIGRYYKIIYSPENSLNYLLRELSLRKQLNDTTDIIDTYINLVYTLVALDSIHEAEKYLFLANQQDSTYQVQDLKGQLFDANGQILMAKKHYSEAIVKFKKSAELLQRPTHVLYQYYYIGNCYNELNRFSNALEYASKAFEMAEKHNFWDIKIKSSLLLSAIYEKNHNPLKAYKYLKIHKTILDEFHALEDLKRAADFEMQATLNQHQLKIQTLEKKEIALATQTKVKNYVIIMISGALLSAIFVVGLFYRNLRQKATANQVLEQQKKALDIKSHELMNSLSKLRETQTQLIQSEKMASLGEFTAGIAHEIQNPLNFVNNFSDLSTELISEMKGELKKANTAEALAIAESIQQNIEKVTFHGKRADSIVKSMLEHSRPSVGQKEPTDINSLASEYFRLAYQGIRAKDPSFIAKLESNFDHTIGKVTIVPQEIGRVFINLFNNAFNAVINKQKMNLPDYEPCVQLSTTRANDRTMVSIRDNGTGIPLKLITKIFQPFFTTKPPGEGTGLGLSLANDIIKAHGGEIRVESQEGIGSNFTILL